MLKYGQALPLSDWDIAIVGAKVRREKALDFSGCKSRPGTGSLHPVAIGAVVEVTKLLKPLV